MPAPTFVTVLARAFLAGEPTVQGIVERGTHALGRRWRWLPPLARRYRKTFAGRTRPRLRDVVGFLLDDQGFRHARDTHALSVGHWLTDPQRMLPAPGVEDWDVPAIESAGALAAWLELDVAELEWFADLKGLGCRRSVSPRLRHYHYRLIEKRSGRVRLIEAPKVRLKMLQRRILAGIVEKVPAHPAVHGFVKGRSIKTFVAGHVGQRIVLRMDLQDFFPSIAGARIQALFRTMGYPEPVADLLGGICTNATPRDVWRVRELTMDPREVLDARALYERPHLPQGGPTSPALGNLCAHRIDCRLTGLARSAGAVYTRYADDLAFSGGETFERCVEWFAARSAAILLEEGFAANHRKTRVMRKGVRQHLAGLVTNECINVRATEFDRLKATLTNCVRLGPGTQNRAGHPAFREHLEGRVSFVEMVHPARGARLRAIFRQIRWP